MRERWFNSEGPFWTAMGRIADIVLLNLVSLLASLPLVSIGAVLVALHDTARQSLAGTGGSVVRIFLSSLRTNWRQATAAWLIVGPLGGLLAAWWLWLDAPELTVLKVLASTVFIVLFPFWWAVLARFENSLGRNLINTVVVTFASLPVALAVAAIDAGIIGLAVAVAIWLPQGLFLLLMLGYPLIVFAHTPLLERALRPLLERAAAAPPGAQQ